ESNETPFVIACKLKMNDIAVKLLEKYGEKCFTIKNDFCSIVKYGCEEVSIKLLEIYGDKLIQQRDYVGYTVLMLSLHNNMQKLSHYLIDNFGEKCLPESKSDYNTTPLILACRIDEELAIKLIET